jgi:hypothetical protein
MADIMPPGADLWKRFRERLKEAGVDGVRCVTADIMSADAIEAIGPHDVVYNSGVVYHMADPIGLIRQLHALTNDYLILGSVVVPDLIETSSGTISIKEGKALFIPGLEPRQLKILAEFFIEQKVPSFTDHASQAWMSPSGIPNYGPWWWLFTPDLLKHMIEVVGFDVLEDSVIRPNFSHGFVCRKAVARVG